MRSPCCLTPVTGRTEAVNSRVGSTADAPSLQFETRAGGRTQPSGFAPDFEGTVSNRRRRPGGILSWRRDRRAGTPPGGRVYPRWEYTPVPATPTTGRASPLFRRTEARRRRGHVRALPHGVERPPGSGRLGRLALGLQAGGQPEQRPPVVRPLRQVGPVDRLRLRGPAGLQ